MEGKIFKMLPLPLNLYYPSFALIMLLLLVFFMDRREIKETLWFGLLWGPVVTFTIFNSLGVIFHLYRYLHAAPFIFWGYPFWTGLAWASAVMLFIHFWPNRPEWYYSLIYIASFAMLSAAIDEVFQKLNLLQYIHWNWFFRFIISFIWFFSASIHWRRLSLKTKKY